MLPWPERDIWDCGRFTFLSDKGRMYSCKFSKVRALRKRKSGPYGQEKTV